MELHEFINLDSPTNYNHDTNPQQPPPPGDKPTTGRQGVKTKKACDSCRSRKKKCDGMQPW